MTNPGVVTGLRWSWRTVLALASPFLAAGIGVYVTVDELSVGWLAGGLLLGADGLAGLVAFLPVRSARIPPATPWEVMFNRRVCDVALGLAAALLVSGAVALLLQGGTPRSAPAIVAIAALPVGLALLTRPLLDLTQRPGDRSDRPPSAGTY